MQVMSTIPPYAPYLSMITGHPSVTGGRLNTVMAIKNESLEELLKRLKAALGKMPLWIDLKCRQLRTSFEHPGVFYNPPEGVRIYEIEGKKVVLDPSNPRALGKLRNPPWADLRLTHKIKLDLSHGPVRCWLQDGYDSAWIVEVDGDRLIMLDGPKRLVGGGESINILDPSLEIEGYFTETDLAYIEAAKKAGIHTYMISYVEEQSDLQELWNLDPEAEIVAKIESAKGLKWTEEVYPKYRDRVRLMAARGDLYVEAGIDRPDKIIPALRTIIEADPNAIVASRILTSLRDSPRPTCPDITDIVCMLQMGYQHFMIGDDICFDENTLLLGLDILHAIGVDYEKYQNKHPKASPALSPA